jgi:hypothetical protein
VEPRTPQKLSLAIGLVISVGAADTQCGEIRALLVLSLPFLMVAAEATTVNEFRERCCHVSNKKAVTGLRGSGSRRRIPGDANPFSRRVTSPGA